MGIFSLHAVLTAMFVAVPDTLVDLGVAQQAHTWVYLPIMLLSFVIAVPMIMVFERRGKAKEVFVFAVSLVIVSLSALIFDRALALFIAALFLFFVAFNLLEAMLPSLVSKLSPAGTRGTAMGIYSSAQFFGAFVGGALGGLVVFYWGSGALFAACASLCCVWLIAAYSMAKPKALKNLSYAVKASVVQLDLLSQAGVEDVVYIEDEKLVYIKVDPSCLDQEALQALIEPYRLSYSGPQSV
ncbi:MAG: MFS transporter [Pontibacterium sp.]